MALIHGVKTAVGAILFLKNKAALSALVLPALSFFEERKINENRFYCILSAFGKMRITACAMAMAQKARAARNGAAQRSKI